MSLIFTDGFDLLSTADLALKWESVALQGPRGSNSVASSGSRFSTGSYYSAGYITSAGTSGGLLTKTLSNTLQSTLICGFAFQGAPLRGNDNGIAAFTDGTTFWVRLDVTAGNQLKVYVNGTAVGTGATTLLNNVWYYIELKAVFSATAGSVEVRLNGVDEIGPIGTLNTGAGGCRFLVLGFVYGVTSGTGGSYNFDDLYVCNGLGTVNNNLLGDVRVAGLVPNGAGTNTGLTRVGGTSAGNYTAVDEIPQDGDTSYVTSSVVGTTDTYVYQDLPSTVGQVLAVVSTPVARRDDSGPRSLTTRVRNNGAEADAGGSMLLLPQYTIGKQIMETNPVTGVAWTVNDVNTSEFGPKVAS